MNPILRFSLEQITPRRFDPAEALYHRIQTALWTIKNRGVVDRFMKDSAVIGDFGKGLPYERYLNFYNLLRAIQRHYGEYGLPLIDRSEQGRPLPNAAARFRVMATVQRAKYSSFRVVLLPIHLTNESLEQISSLIPKKQLNSFQKPMETQTPIGQVER